METHNHPNSKNFLNYRTFVPELQFRKIGAIYLDLVVATNSSKSVTFFATTIATFQMRFRVRNIEHIWTTVIHIVYVASFVLVDKLKKIR